MLLLSREVDNVLLICPKPLVTNWVREFRQWAPEVTSGGDRRGSSSSTVDLERTRWHPSRSPLRAHDARPSMIDEGDLRFDLVVLD